MYSIFISYKYEDRKRLDKIVHWKKKGSFDKDIDFIFEDKDARQEGERGIRKQLSPKLNGMSLLLVLVGDDTHSSQWIGYEIQHAKTHKKKILAVHLPDTGGGLPREISTLKTINYDPQSINGAILKALKADAS